MGKLHSKQLRCQIFLYCIKRHSDRVLAQMRNMDHNAFRNRLILIRLKRLEIRMKQTSTNLMVYGNIARHCIFTLNARTLEYNIIIGIYLYIS